MFRLRSAPLLMNKSASTLRFPTWQGHLAPERPRAGSPCHIFFAWEQTLLLFGLDIGHHAARWMCVGEVVCSLFFLGREWH